jgi:hypothetical protein
MKYCAGNTCNMARFMDVVAFLKERERERERERILFGDPASF